MCVYIICLHMRNVGIYTCTYNVYTCMLHMRGFSICECAWGMRCLLEWDLETLLFLFLFIIRLFNLFQEASIIFVMKKT